MNIGSSIVPAPLDVPITQRASGTTPLRYDDVTQDGRMTLAALPHSLTVVWQSLGPTPLEHAARKTGIVPILTRLCCENGDETISALEPVSCEGEWALAHGRGADGAVDRLFLLLWVTVTGRRGRMHGPPPSGAGEPVFVGRVFAEHVFTRPFAAPADRKVLALPRADGATFVPDAQWTWRPAVDLLELPAGGTWLDPGPVREETDTVFGLDHTDANQHVNSGVYPQLVHGIALRRLSANGRHGPWLARSAEVGYRKPCFAGESVRFETRAFDAPGDRAGVSACLRPEGAVGGPPSMAARIVFSR